MKYIILLALLTSCGKPDVLYNITSEMDDICHDHGGINVYIGIPTRLAVGCNDGKIIHYE